MDMVVNPVSLALASVAAPGSISSAASGVTVAGIAPSPLPEALPTPPVTHPLFRANPLQGCRVFMVDDQQTVLDSVRPFLETEGMIVQSTTDPRDALKRLLTTDYDLLITDLVMPGLDGVTLLNCLIDARRYIPSLVLSGSQGNRQAAFLLQDFSSDELLARLPFRYMKKEEREFARELLTRLVHLRRMPRLDHEGVAENVLPRLRSVLERTADDRQSDGARLSRNKRRMAMIERLVDNLLDARFSMFLDAAPHFRRIADYASSLPEGNIKESLGMTCLEWEIISRRERIQILSLDARGWHDFKNEISGCRIRASSTLFILSRPGQEVPAPVLESVQFLFGRASTLTFLALHIYKIILTNKRIEVAIFDEVRKDLKHLSWEGSVGMDKFGVTTTLPDEPGPVLTIPAGTISSILVQLVTNAFQATLPEAPSPMVHVSVKDKALRLAVTNHGDEIPDEVRERMLQGDRFTTKTYGSGTGLVVVHEYLREVGGHLEVASAEGQNTVAALIPFP